MNSGENLTRILIIDDDEDDFFITSDYIKRIPEGKFHIDWCFRYQDALEKLKQHTYHLYFVDYYLGAKTGLDLIREATEQHCEEPMVLLTGKGNQAIDRQAMQAGAMDYLVKSELNVEKLERCIRYALERSGSLKALKANERKFRSLFERSKDSVFLADRSLRFKDVNETTTAVLGFSKQELLEMDLYAFVGASDKEPIREKLEKEGRLNDYELDIVSSDGDRKTCILSLSTEIDTGGTEYIHGLMHDITHLKKAEKMTLQAEKLAATGRLVQTLAHEVRNPLNNINLSVEQLHSDHVKHPEENEIYIDIIQRNCKRIGDLITELLNSSRPTEMVMAKMTIQEIMDESITAALDRITLQRVKLQVRYSDKPAFIHADEQKLKIAFLNIIINAVEAMKEEEGRLEITISYDLQRHIVRISDNGSGISEENLSKLFEPYFTLKRNGLGLGLAATLNILQSHKAHIEVSSAVNEGTMFTISFPSVLADPVKDEIQLANQ